MTGFRLAGARKKLPLLRRTYWRSHHPSGEGIAHRKHVVNAVVGLFSTVGCFASSNWPASAEFTVDSPLALTTEALAWGDGDVPPLYFAVASPSGNVIAAIPISAREPALVLLTRGEVAYSVRRGSGPGTLTRPTSMVWRGDSIGVVDGGRRTIALVSPSGVVLAERRMRSPAGVGGTSVHSLGDTWIRTRRGGAVLEFTTDSAVAGSPIALPSWFRGELDLVEMSSGRLVGVGTDMPCFFDLNRTGTASLIGCLPQAISRTFVEARRTFLRNFGRRAERARPERRSFTLLGELGPEVVALRGLAPVLGSFSLAVDLRARTVQPLRLSGAVVADSVAVTSYSYSASGQTLAIGGGTLYLVARHAH